MTMQPTRRELMAAIRAAAPLAAMLADAGLARAAAAALEEVSLTTTGGRPVKAALALPAAQPAPSLMLIHEWWGLNDQIKAVAAECAKQGYAALAVDLYDGRSAADGRRSQAADAVSRSGRRHRYAGLLGAMAAHPAERHRSRRRRSAGAWAAAGR